MNKRCIRITTTQTVLESELKRADYRIMRKWLSNSIEELEYKLRYSTGGETTLLQGAIRALDDIAQILKQD